MEELSRVSELNFTYRYVEIDPYEATDGADTKRSLSLAEKVNPTRQWHQRQTGLAGTLTRVCGVGECRHGGIHSLWRPVHVGRCQRWCTTVSV
jgi:hypothetical protein